MLLVSYFFEQLIPSIVMWLIVFNLLKNINKVQSQNFLNHLLAVFGVSLIGGFCRTFIYIDKDLSALVYAGVIPITFSVLISLLLPKETQIKQEFSKNEFSKKSHNQSTQNSSQKNLTGSNGNYLKEAKTSVAEDGFWEIVIDEFEGLNRKKGLWAKCYAEANGNESIAKAEYLKTRFEELKNELPPNNSSEKIVNKNSPSKRIASGSYERIESSIKEDISYSEFSLTTLLERKMYATKKYKNRTLLFFHNGNVGCISGSLVKVFETENFCTKAINDGYMSIKHPKGLLVVINLDTFEIAN
jgi:hypothetical protein